MCYIGFSMRQKSTVESLEYRNQFQETPDEIRRAKEEKVEHSKKEEKQRQSEFWIKKETAKKK